LGEALNEERQMQLNADFTTRAAMHGSRLPWTPSPIAGVDRRMLERIGGEVARATSIVRYAPNSHFSAHTHHGGEEFLVLEGVFSDEHGDFPAGSYVRNPPTSRHVPGSEPGCTIFVKLWQFDLDDRVHVRLDTRNMSFSVARDRPGVATMPLFTDAREEVRLERWAPGCEVELSVPAGIELFVVSGGFTEGGEDFESQSWLRLPAGAMLKAKSPAGCTVWLKIGHLAHHQTAPHTNNTIGGAVP
jgi:ChrR Cupin-like domain